MAFPSDLLKICCTVYIIQAGWTGEPMERHRRSVTFSLAGNQSGNQRDSQKVIQRGCLAGEPYFCSYIKSSQVKFYLYCLKSTITICVRGLYTPSSVLRAPQFSSGQEKLPPNKNPSERPKIQNSPPRTERHAVDISPEHIQTITVHTVHFSVNVSDTH